MYTLAFSSTTGEKILEPFQILELYFLPVVEFIKYIASPDFGAIIISREIAIPEEISYPNKPANFHLKVPFEVNE